MKAVYAVSGQDIADGYDHDDQDIRVVSYRSRQEYRDDTPGGRHLGMTKEVRIRWVIKAASQAELAGKLVSAEAAYENATAEGGTFRINQDSGLARHIFSGDGAGGVGVRVRSFGYPINKAIEGSTVRTAEATLSFGAIIDPEQGTEGTPYDPGDDYDANTNLSAVDWNNPQAAGDGTQGSGGTEFKRSESYSVSGGEARYGVVELPTGDPYVYLIAARSVRTETYTVTVNSKGNFVNIPASIISGTGLRREINRERKKGRPPTYQTAVTYTLRS